MTGYIYAFIKIIKKIIAKVQMFMFGLTCLKARKAKTIAIFLNILRNRSGFMWLQGKWCLYNEQRFPSQ